MRSMRPRKAPKYKRHIIESAVESWLPKPTVGKILKIVSANGGICSIREQHDQMKIIFPDINLSIKDPSLVFGLILDKFNGWSLCVFKSNINDIGRSPLKEVISDIGFDNNTTVASKLFTAFKDSGDSTSPKMLFNVVSVLIHLTKPKD